MAGSTEYIIKTIAQSPPVSEWAVGTEVLSILANNTLTFSGRAPDEAEGHVEIEVVATDTDNLTASGSFFLFFAARS